MTPKIRIHKPRKRADRWWLQADVNLAGERIELIANASSTLANRAVHWFSQIASRVAKNIVGYDGEEPLGAGVFGEVPHLASTIGGSRVVPQDVDVENAATLYFKAKAGDQAANEHMRMLFEFAAHDEMAASALDDLQLIELTLFQRDTLPMQRVFIDAAEGSPHAQKVLAALHQTATTRTPTRVQWWMDDYVNDPQAMIHDVVMATGDEIGAKLVRPARRPRVRHVSRGNGQLMLQTFRELNRRYS